MNQDLMWQNIRYLLLAGGGFLVGKGYFTTEELTAVISALGVIFTFAWGNYIKYGTKTVSGATGARSNVPTLSPLTGNVQ